MTFCLELRCECRRLLKRSRNKNVASNPNITGREAFSMLLADDFINDAADEMGYASENASESSAQVMVPARHPLVGAQTNGHAPDNFAGGTRFGGKGLIGLRAEMGGRLMNENETAASWLILASTAF